jgi:arginine decarboxylase
MIRAKDDWHGFGNLAPGFNMLDPIKATIVDYLKFARDFNERFPGFETDVHGLVTREVDGKRGYFVDCVRQE